MKKIMSLSKFYNATMVEMNNTMFSKQLMI